MADKITPEQRSRTMRAVKSKDTKPEMVVRRMLHRLGYRFRLHRKDLPGKPDIVLPRHKKVIFVHGCFWHGHAGCRQATRPTSNVAYWSDKIDGNIMRGRHHLQQLDQQGWHCLVLWGCAIKDQEALRKGLQAFLGNG